MTEVGPRASWWCRLQLVCAMGLFMALALTGEARADGAFFGGASEPSQEAVILFDGSNEQMSLRVAYQGAVGDFGWVVPLPSEPVIEESGTELFEYLYGNYGSAVAVNAVRKAGEPSWLMSNSVEVLQERRLGVFDAAVLRASDPGGLAAWLEERGYAYGPEQAELFRHYTDKGWCFAAFRIAPEAVWAAQPDQAEGDAAYLQPLRFSFATPRAVFPLRLSSGNPSASSVRLFVLGEDTFSCESMPERATYALGPGELDGLKAYLPALGTAAAGGKETYLTVFDRTFSTGEMTDDLVFLPDPDPVALPEGLPFVSLAQDPPADLARRPGRLAVLLALAILVLSLAAIPLLLRNRTQTSAWRLFTGLCATVVTMAVVATLAMAILYRQDQERAGSSEWRGLGTEQDAAFTRSEFIPGDGASAAQLRTYAGRILPDGRLRETEVDTREVAGFVAGRMSPDGRRLALVQDGELVVLDLGEDGRVEGRRETGESVAVDEAVGPSWDPTGSRLAFLAAGLEGSRTYGALVIYDAEAQKSRVMREGRPAAFLLGWSDDGRYLVSARGLGDEREGTTYELEAIDAGTGSVACAVSLPARPDRWSFPSGCWMGDGRVVVLRGIGQEGQTWGGSGLELLLFDASTGQGLESLKLRQQVQPVLVRTAGEGGLFLLGLGRSEDNDGWAWKRYVIELEGLKVSEKLERVLSGWSGEAETPAALAVPWPLMGRATLDRDGRYLLLEGVSGRTVLADLAEGELRVVSGLRAAWAPAR